MAKAPGSIALLRGVNVGGNNKLPMKDLAGLFAAAGCTDVRTYIQSGNVVFRAPEALVAGLGARLATRIETQFGFAVPVVVRTHDEMAAAVARNPFLGRDDTTEMLHVMFLADVPTAEDLAKLDPARSPPDEFALVGRELYLRLPNGVGRSKLTNAYVDARLKTVSTARNWRTVLTLLEMVAH